MTRRTIQRLRVVAVVLTLWSMPQAAPRWWPFPKSWWPGEPSVLHGPRAAAVTQA